MKLKISFVYGPANYKKDKCIPGGVKCIMYILKKKYKLDFVNANKRWLENNSEEYAFLDSLYTEGIERIYDINEEILFSLNQVNIKLPEKILRLINKDSSEILKSNCQICCISVTLKNIYYSLALARILKKDANMNIIAGGPAVNYPAIRKFILESRLADCVIVGEADNMVLRAIEKIKQSDFRNESRILFDYEDNKNLMNIGIPEKINFDLHEFCDSDDFDCVIASRGCVYNCAFCEKNRNIAPFRQREVNDVIAEIKKMPAKKILFNDQLLNCSPEWLNQLVTAIIEEKISKKFFCAMRTQNLSIEILKKMKKAGFSYLMYGVEHFSERILESINKNVNKKEMISVLKKSGEAGLDTCINLIAGLPGEKLQDLAEVYKTMKHLTSKHPGKYNVSINCFSLVPNSDMFNSPESYGLKIIGKKDSLNAKWGYNDRPVEEYLLHNTLTKRFTLQLNLNASHPLLNLDILNKKIGDIKETIEGIKSNFILYRKLFVLNISPNELELIEGKLGKIREISDFRFAVPIPPCKFSSLLNFKKYVGYSDCRKCMYSYNLNEKGEIYFCKFLKKKIDAKTAKGMINACNNKAKEQIPAKCMKCRHHLKYCSGLPCSAIQTLK